MERFVGVEEARARLGKLVEEVAESGNPVALTKRGRALAMIVVQPDQAARLRASTRAAG
jgi:prevent-host-death family protein